MRYLRRAILTGLFFTYPAVIYANDTVRWGLEAGWAIEQPFSDANPSRVQLAILHGQSLIRLSHSGVHERLELINEVSVIESLYPSKRLIFGPSELLRSTLGSGHVCPFIDIGAGIASSALHDPVVHEMSGWLQYQLQVGAGVKLRRESGRRLLLEYRFTHFSNNDTMWPNRGLNLHTAIVGINF